MGHHLEIEKQDVIVLSDIHGRFDLLETLIKQVEENEVMLLLGDYCDRGKDSLQVIKLVKELVENGRAIAVKGNHDQMFLDFLDDPSAEPDWYFGQGGRETVQSFYGGNDIGFNVSLRYTPEKIAQDILMMYPELIDFLRALPLTIEMDGYLFVHAGVKSHSKDWKSSTLPQEYLWIRQDFYLRPNDTGKRILFGHTSAYHLPLHDTPIWVNKEGNLFGIDGGAGGSGCLNGVRIQNGKIIGVYKVYKYDEWDYVPFER